MKLFAFVRRARRSSTTTTTTSSAPVPAAAQEEDVSDGAGGGGPSEKRRRRSSAAAWKPTLVAISEDAAVTAETVAAQQAKPAARKADKARPSPRAAARWSYDDHFRYSGPPTMLPAFTPTAFLF